LASLRIEAVSHRIRSDRPSHPASSASVGSESRTDPHLAMPSAGIMSPLILEHLARRNVAEPETLEPVETESAARTPSPDKSPHRPASMESPNGSHHMSNSNSSKTAGERRLLFTPSPRLLQTRSRIGSASNSMSSPRSNASSGSKGSAGRLELDAPPARSEPASKKKRSPFGRNSPHGSTFGQSRSA